MSNFLLSEAELEEFTDAKQSVAQAAFLKEAKIPFEISKKNKVKVVRAWAERAPFENNKIEATPVQGRGPKIAGFGSNA